MITVPKFSIFLNRKPLTSLEIAKINKQFKPINTEKYIGISPLIEGRTYNYINGIKSTIANYAERNNLKVKFHALEGTDEEILMSVDKKTLKPVNIDHQTIVGDVDSFASNVVFVSEPEKNIPLFVDRYDVDPELREMKGLDAMKNEKESFARQIYKALENVVHGKTDEEGI